MSLSIARPFALSFTLHVLFGAAVLLPLLFESQRRVGPVMILVADALASSSDVQARDENLSAVKFTMPVPPRRPAESPVPERAPSVQTSVAPAPRRASPPPAPAPRSTQSAQPKSAPASETSQGQRMSLAEFRSKHGTPAETPQARRGDRPHPRLSENFAPEAGTSRPAKLEDQGFGARLLGDLRAAFVSPGVDRELSATVTFTVDASGKIKGVRITRSSGSVEFDSAVLAAFEHVRAQGLAPGDIGQLFEVTFAQREK